MAKILEQLYCGELFPYERYKPTIETLGHRQKKALDSYTDLITKLPLNQQEQFTDIIDEYSVETVQAFRTECSSP